MDVPSIIKYLDEKIQDLTMEIRQIDMETNKFWDQSRRERMSLLEEQRTNSEAANKIYSELREHGQNISPTMVLKLHGDATWKDAAADQAATKTKNIHLTHHEQTEELRSRKGYYDLKDQIEKYKKEIERLRDE